MTEQPAEPQPPAVDPLEALDFTIECGMIHATGPCHRDANYVATIHVCNQPEGIRVVVCDWFVISVVEAEYGNARCVNCNKTFSSMLDRAWDIQPLKRPL